MIRGRDIMRLPVIVRDEGQRVGQVEDVIIDRNGTRVLGILVDEKGLFGKARVVAWPGIQSFGLDVVIIDSATSVVKASEAPEITAVLDRGLVLEGSRIETTDGRELGVIENIYFDPETGAVEGFELSGGRNENAPSGQAFLPASPSFEAGKDYSFIDPSAAESIVDLKTALEGRREQEAPGGGSDAQPRQQMPSAGPEAEVGQEAPGQRSEDQS
jgi:uncharacterized protein YrrD